MGKWTFPASLKWVCHIMYTLLRFQIMLSFVRIWKAAKSCCLFHSGCYNLKRIYTWLSIIPAVVQPSLVWLSNKKCWNWWQSVQKSCQKEVPFWVWCTPFYMGSIKLQEKCSICNTSGSNSGYLCRSYLCQHARLCLCAGHEEESFGLPASCWAQNQHWLWVSNPFATHFLSFPSAS